MKKVGNKKQYLKQIGQVLGKVFTNYLQLTKGRNLAVIVSGGIDSSVVTRLAYNRYKNLKLYSLVSEESRDRPFLNLIEKELDLKISKISFKEGQIDKSLLKKIEKILKAKKLKPTLVNLSMAYGFYLLFDKIAKDGSNYVLTGQGPDILLGGYHKYNGLTGQKLKNQIKEDLKDLKVDIARDSAMAEIFDLALLNPYLEQSFINFCLDLPARMLVSNGQSKYILRQYGAELGLPRQIVNRPKQAFQYSTRLSKAIRKELVKSLPRCGRANSI